MQQLNVYFEMFFFCKGHFVEGLQWEIQENRNRINKPACGKNVHYQSPFEDLTRETERRRK